MIGIYIIINKINSKCYIGQSINIAHRWTSHKTLLNREIHPNIHLQRAWNIYGESAFSLDILEECVKDKIILKESEQYWMDYLKFIGGELYNIAEASGSCLGKIMSDEHKKRISWKGKFHSSETKQKMSESAATRMTPELKKHLSSINKGHVVSEETRKKIRDKKIGIPGRSLTEEEKIAISLRMMNNTIGTGRNISEETRKKISDSNKGHAVSLETREKITKANTGRKVSEETREKMRNKIFTEEHRQHLSEAQKGKRKPLSEEHKKNISQALKNKNI